MPSLPIYDLNKQKVGTIDLSDAIFAAEVKPHLLNEAVRVKIARKYEFKTANSLTRTEVQATGKKMYKQKGTGQARHGDAKAPIFVGGGKAHGPKPRRVQKKMNKKARKGALISALSWLQQHDRLFVVKEMVLPNVSTKAVAKTMEQFGLTKTIFVNSAETKEENQFNSSAKNIPEVKVLAPEGLNVFDILKYGNLLVSSTAAKKVTERLSHV